MQVKKLSILIPAYNFQVGVLNILNNLLVSERRDDLEIIISDDSSSPDLGVFVGDFARAHDISIRYVYNNPALGAVANWNFLIDSAVGEYVWIIHHDEWPGSKDVVANVLDILDRGIALDILVLDVFLCESFEAESCRRHVPTLLKKFVFSRFPCYLLRRNLVGPTAALVIRRKICPRFDVKLKWTVDVDFYIRLLMARPALYFDERNAIYSLLNRTDSITATIKTTVDDILKFEIGYMSNRIPIRCSFGLKLLQRGTPIYVLLSLIEGLAWTIFRIYYRLVFVVSRRFSMIIANNIS